MSAKSRIEWTDATWNPLTGCTKVSAGCKHCYAERNWPRLVHLPAFQGRAFTDVAYHANRIAQPLSWKKPRRIFVNSMSDLFHPDVQTHLIDEVFGVMAGADHHTFQVLTKRPERMLAYLSTFEAEANARDYVKFWPQATTMKWPLPNVWLGVSVEDQATADERIPLLLDTPAAVRFVSCEPLLGPIDLSPWAELGGPNTNRGLSNPGLDWVIVGGESGPKARPMHLDWVRDIRDDCAEAGVAFLFKQWGEWTPGVNVYRNSGTVETAFWINSAWSFGKEDLATEGCHIEDEPDLYRVGKKASGRLLDGVLHDNYPEINP